jgi:hypothetical protein
MNKITTLSEYKLHKNKLNRESYHKRKALVKNARDVNGELIYKPKIKKERSNKDIEPKRIKKKKPKKDSENPFY